jgi:hypothetical protein
MPVEPYDDATIVGEDLLIRRIDPEFHVVPDHNKGGLRLSTKAFCESSEGSQGMSVDLKGDIVGASLDPRAYVRTPKYVGAVEFTARIPRSVDLAVGKEPEKNNPYHGEVWRLGESRRFTGRQKKTLLENSTWLNEIDGVNLRS